MIEKIEKPITPLELNNKVNEIIDGLGNAGKELFDIVQKDHILTYEETQGYELLGNYVYKTAIAGSRYGYPDFYNKCLEEKEASTATQVTLGENTITMYVNANGHQFFDIANKDAVDAFYNATGTAWFYGIDTTNERVLLPRNDYVELTTKDKVPVRGNGMALGLTNGSSYAGLQSMKFASGTTNAGELKVDEPSYGVEIGTAGTSNNSSSAFNTSMVVGLTDEAEYSGVEVDLSTYTSKKYYYMVVGNTAVESAVTDVIDVTTSENDTIPLFHNFWSKEDMTTTGCYVNASLGSFLSGNIYTTAYNTLVGKLGTGNVKSVSDNYTDYDFVVNADNMTFRLPLKNGQEIMFATAVKGNGMTLGLTNGTANYGLQVGTTGQNGYIASTAKYGTAISSGESSTGVLTSGTSLGITLDSTKSGIELDTENITIPEGWNLYYKVANAVQNLEILDVANVIADLNTKIGKAECPRYVVEVSDKSLLPSWYVVYNDGWCEQGGQVTYDDTYNWIKTIDLLKEYKNKTYSINTQSLTNETAGNNASSTIQVQEQTATSFTLINYGYSSAHSNCGFYWETKGYIN